MLSRIRSLLEVVLRRSTVENDMAGEMEFHLAARRDELIRRGLSFEEASRHARLEFGAVERYKEECRESLGLRLLDQLRGDLRYAWRQFSRTPTFTILAVVILALGIGGNTAIFSVVYAVLLRPLPYPEPDRIVRLARQSTTRLWEYLSIPQYEFWRDHSSAFSSIAAHRGVGERALFLGAGREWIRVMPVTDGFFRTLGIAPELGREFVRDETLPQNPRALILTDGLWRRTFEADPGVIGRSLRLDDENLTVVGVLPAGFWFPQPADAFITLRAGRGLADTGSNTQVIARVGADRTLRQAQAEMAGVFAAYRQAQPDRLERSEQGMALIPYQESLAGNVRLTLLLLFAAVAFLLLIACSNLACLLLARLAARQREIAVRLALGSGRARLLKQFLTENLMLAFFGAVTGLLVAFGLLRTLIAVIPLELPSAVPIRLDPPVLLFTLASALATGVLFSLAPVFTAWRLDLNSSLKEGALQLFEPRPPANSCLARYRADRALNDAPCCRRPPHSNPLQPASGKARLHGARRDHVRHAACGGQASKQSRVVDLSTQLAGAARSPPRRPGSRRHQSVAAHRLPQFPGAARRPPGSKHWRHGTTRRHSRVLRPDGHSITRGSYLHSRRCPWIRSRRAHQ